MPRIRAKFSVNHGGQEIGGTGAAPLRCVYVRHEPLGPTYITDINGVVKDKDGNEGIDSLTPWADITIHCQNSVARVLNGTDIFQGCPKVSFRITRPAGGARVTGTINASVPGLAHFQVLNQVFAAYHLVWRQFEPFLSAGEFPLGRSQDLEATRNQQKRIEVMLPSPVSALPGIASALGITLPPTMSRVLSLTDPVGTPDGWPRIYVEPDPPETRLFTGNGQLSPSRNRKGLELIPSELAHALHFSLFTKAKRQSIRNDYLGFIFGQLVNGLQATHDIGVQTSPMVAYIEALDHFSHRFSEHARSRLTTFPTNTPAPGLNYVTNELKGKNPVTPRVGRLAVDNPGGHMRIAGKPATGLTLSGTLDEGAIFGGLFLGLALHVGLKEVVEAIFESKKLNFGQFRTWFNSNRSSLSTKLDDVVTNWGL